MSRFVGHLKSNVVAYLALFLALGAGGGYAAAATVSSPTVHGCVINRTGELLVRSRCGRGEHKLLLNAAVSTTEASGEVDSQGSIRFESGMVIKQIATGTFRVTITLPACRGRDVYEIPVVSPAVSTGPGTPMVLTNFAARSASSFEVYADQVINGGLVPGNQGFNIADVCAR